MAHINKVLHSINDKGTNLCVDIFQRPDGTVGFEEFRRDAEDARGWFPIGGHGERVFTDQKMAFAAALSSVKWLNTLDYKL